MGCPRSLTLLLLVLPIVLLCSHPSSAHRVQKGGCLNYGHSCLGAHGKRTSWRPDARPSSRPPTLPRPFLDIFLNALSTPKHTDAHSQVYASSSDSVIGRRARFPEGGSKSAPTTELLGEPGGLEARMGGVLGVLGGDVMGGRDRGDADQDPAFYDGEIDDEYTDTRYKRHASPQLGLERPSVLPKRADDDGGRVWQLPLRATAVRDAADHEDLALRMMARWLMR